MRNLKRHVNIKYKKVREIVSVRIHALQTPLEPFIQLRKYIHTDVERLKHFFKFAQKKFIIKVLYSLKCHELC